MSLSSGNKPRNKGYHFRGFLMNLTVQWNRVDFFSLYKRYSWILEQQGRCLVSWALSRLPSPAMMLMDCSVWFHDLKPLTLESLVSLTQPSVARLSVLSSSSSSGAARCCMFSLTALICYGLVLQGTCVCTHRVSYSRKHVCLVHIQELLSGMPTVRLKLPPLAEIVHAHVTCKLDVLLCRRGGDAAVYAALGRNPSMYMSLRRGSAVKSAGINHAVM